MRHFRPRTVSYTHLDVYKRQMQEYGKDDAGNCYAVHAKAGEVVIVPPGWVHATINANVEKPLTFGAWCVRDFGFDYEEVDVYKRQGKKHVLAMIDELKGF